MLVDICSHKGVGVRYLPEEKPSASAKRVGILPRNDHGDFGRGRGPFMMLLKYVFWCHVQPCVAMCSHV